MLGGIRTRDKSSLAEEGAQETTVRGERDREGLLMTAGSRTIASQTGKGLGWIVVRLVLCQASKGITKAGV